MDTDALNKAEAADLVFDLTYVAHVKHQHSNLIGRLVEGSVAVGDVIVVGLETGETCATHVFSLERDIDGVLRGRHIERAVAPCLVCLYVRWVAQQPIQVPQSITRKLSNSLA